MTHLFICGRPGAGKSRYMVSIFQKSKIAGILVNTQGSKWISTAGDGPAVENLTDLAVAMKNGRRKIVFVPSAYDDIALNQIRELSRQLIYLGREAAKNETGNTDPKTWLMLFVDECHEFAWKDPRFKSPIVPLWKRGRGFGIYCVGASQRPADVSHSILSLSETHIIFSPGVYDYPYFQNYNIPIDDYKEWLSRDYHYLAFTPKGIKQMLPIKL